MVLCLVFLLGSVLGLMLIGMPVAIAFIGANIAGAIYFMGGYGDFLFKRPAALASY